MLGNHDGTPQVVRARGRGLRIALGVAAALIALFALYVVYELGRYNAGYDRQAVAQQRTELEVKIEHLEKDNREMRTQLAELDTFRVGRLHEQQEVSRAMGELQAQVAQQSQELNFYRGVVAQGALAMGVRIEQPRITAGSRPGSYLVHLSLLRSGKADSDVVGTLVLGLDGTQDGEAKSLDLAAMTGGRVHEVHFNFRYLQAIEQELLVPAAFKPGQLQVEVRSVKKDVAPVSQSFLWTVESTP
jgi:hypothetical protein